LEVAEVLSQVKLSIRTSTQEKLHNTGNVLQEKLLFRRTCPLAIFLEKKLNFFSEEVAQGQKIWPLQHPPTTAMEVTVDWKIHVQAARLHVWHLVVAHSWTTLWLRGAGGQLGS